MARAGRKVVYHEIPTLEFAGKVAPIRTELEPSWVPSGVFESRLHTPSSHVPEGHGPRITGDGQQPPIGRRRCELVFEINNTGASQFLPLDVAHDKSMSLFFEGDEFPVGRNGKEHE